MAIKFHPPKGTVVTVNYDKGFKNPEMDKLRLAVVVSPPIKARQGLITVVPLSLSPPKEVMPYHTQINIPFQLPDGWGNLNRWVKGDMINSVGFHRVELLNLGKNIEGKRIYQTKVLPDCMMKNIYKCVLHGIGLSILTKNI